MPTIRYYTGLSNLVLLPTLTTGYMDPSIYEEVVEKLDSFLIFKWRDDEEDFVQDIKEAFAPELSAEYVYDLYREGYQPEDLAKHRAVITLPYSVMSYRTSELYALAIPLFVPSLKFFRFVNRTVMTWTTNKNSLFCVFRAHFSKKMQTWSLGWDRTISGQPYCPTGDGHVEIEGKNRRFISNSRQGVGNRLIFFHFPVFFSSKLLSQWSRGLFKLAPFVSSET